MAKIIYARKDCEMKKKLTLEEALHKIGEDERKIWHLEKVAKAADALDRSIFPRFCQNHEDIEYEGECLTVLHNALNELYERRDPDPLLIKVENDLAIDKRMQEGRKNK